MASSLLNVVVDSFLNCEAPPQEMFVDEINYLHHVKFVLPFCDKAREITVCRSESYVIISLEFLSGSANYLYGIASDGKIFVTNVRMSLEGRLVEQRFVKGRKVFVFNVDDSLVRKMLGYDYDSEGEEVVIDKPGRYRVQGDLIIDVRPLPKLSDVLRSITDFQERTLLDIVARTLVSKRLNILIEGYRIRIPFPHAVSDVMERKIAKLLYKELGGTIFDSIDNRKFLIELNGSNDYDNCVVSVGALQNSVYVSAACGWIYDEGNPIASNLLGKLHSDFHRAYKPINDEMMIGNHYVKMENVRSASVRFKPTIQPLMLGDSVVEVIDRDGWYLVTPSSTVTLIHDEHGVTKVTFKNEYMIRFRNIDVGPDHVGERNAIIMKLLDI